jgi:hypothetical protein
VAEILIFADKETVPLACARYGVADRTVRRWKAKVESGKWPAVADLVRDLKSAALERTKDLLAQVYEAALRKLLEKLPDASYRETLETVTECGGLKELKDALNVSSNANTRTDPGDQKTGGPGPEAPGGAGMSRALRAVS